MTLKKIFIVIMTCFLLVSGNAFAEESLDNSNEIISALDLPAYQEYQPKKNEIVFNKSSMKINYVNPTAYSNKQGSYLPGARGMNQLVVYTGGYAIRTGTNEFGAEAVVEGNTVTEISGADSFIPANGLVISGHGVAKNWINKNIKIGTKVYIDSVSNTLYVYTTSESYLFEASKKIDEAKAMVDYYKGSVANYDFKVPNDYIKEAQDYLKKAQKDSDNIQKYSQASIESAIGCAL